MGPHLNKMEIATLKNISILYVEDDTEVQSTISLLLEMYFKAVYTTSNGLQGIELFRKHSPDIVLTDIQMPDMDGLEMAQLIKKESPNTPIIIITAYCEVDLLLKSIEIGVDSYVRKPLVIENVFDNLYKCALPIIQKKEIENLSKKIFTSLELRVSKSQCMQDALKRVQRMAGCDFSVIIYGETGVGKSYLARIIHDLSQRSGKPFVTVDIGAIPESLMESELFGHMKGAFTGADKVKKGFFEIANGGTLFLEDLENVSPYAQSKLLRAVEDKEIYPLGSTTPIVLDIRIIGATNVDLFEEVKKKKFREDLFYRLCEYDIQVPPIRERPEDILMLAQKFTNEISEELDKNIKKVSDEAIEILKNYYWRGNIRELKNIMRRAVINCEESIICANVINKTLHISQNNKAELQDFSEDIVGCTLQQVVENAEKKIINYALKKTNNKITKTASYLQADYKTLMRKIKKYGIKIR